MVKKPLSVKSKDLMLEVENICSSLKNIKQLSEENRDKLISIEIYRLDEIYKFCYDNKSLGYARVLGVIEYKLLTMFSSREIGFDIDIRRKMAQSIELNNQSTFVLVYLKYTEKNVIKAFNKYIRTLRKIKNVSSKERKFVFLYLAMEYGSHNDRDVYLNELWCSVSERDNLIAIKERKSDYKAVSFEYPLANVVVMIKIYTELSSMGLYDEDSILMIKEYKQKISHVFKYFGVYDTLNNLVRVKILSFVKDNVVSRDVHRANCKYGFEFRILNNKVFIKSKLDNWYIDVDKPNNECVLYHGNDGEIDGYHYQDRFAHTNIYKILRYIAKHDDYCLYGGRKKKAMLIKKHNWVN